MPLSSPSGPVLLPAMTCCLPGFTYDSGTLKCINNLNPATIADPVPCACCPPGYTFVDGAGGFYNAGLVYTLITNPTASDFFNTCVQIVNAGWAIAAPSGNDPITCPCCPAGYMWLSNIQQCVELTNPKVFSRPIPCVACICNPTPPPPPVCPTCNQQNISVPISFTFNPNQKNCKDCETVGPPVGLGGCADTFFPIQLMDPIINFTLYS